MSDSVKRESGSIEMRGAPLYYEVAGAGSTLVLLHEGIADCRMYDDQFEAIARQHQVVRYDFHGFGRSGTPTEPYTHHEGLRSLLEHLGIDRAGILGMSLGGSVALDFALTYPARVDALLLLAAGIGGYPPSDSSATLFAPVVEAYQTGDVAKGIERMVAIWVDGMERRPEEVDPIVRERVREMYTAVLRRTREGERSADALDPPA